MKLLLTRLQAVPASNSVFGELYVDGVKECVTLENLDLIISIGTYPVGFYHSPRFNRLVPLLVVPHREYIEMHPANYSHQLQGCIAVGTVRNQDSISNSQFAFQQLMDKIKGADSLEIEIVNA